MSKYKTDVVYKVTKEAKGNSPEMGYLYIKNAPVTFASVLKPNKKHKSEDLAYQLNVFVNSDTNDKLTEIGVNKTFAEVGVTKKTKGENRGQVKYPLDEHNKDFEGMFAAQLVRETVKRDKKSGELLKEFAPLKVVDAEGNPFTQEVGNGSVCTLKIFCYRSDGMLNTQLETVVVVDHVPFVRNGGDSFDEELGITVRSGSKSEVAESDSELSNDVPEDNSDSFNGSQDADDLESSEIPF